MSKKIFYTLRANIVAGVYKPGHRIVELDLAKDFGCSQAPVREALQRLEEQGLVRIVEHTGSFVTEISGEEMKELFDIRVLIETRAVREAAYKVSELDRNELQRIVSRMFEAAKGNDLYQLIELDMQFHEMILCISGRQTSLRIWRLIDGQIRRFLTITHPRYFHNLEEIAGTHQELLQAILQGSMMEAEAACERHILLVWEKTNDLKRWGT